ncbi:MAG: class I SAM-dependent methyltransferase [Gemmatimonadetes bacterium]|nr:class I SAM-dependent methyltransferase [Gemmatimonadota bacterium]
MPRMTFAQRYRAHMRRVRRPERTAEHWDARAVAMSATVFEGEYLQRFLARLDLAGCRTLLDVGCGPGTIGLSVAPRLEHVYGLDFSAGMLAAFGENARVRGLANVTPIRLGWDDDWAAVPACDVVVASRSTVVPDLEAAVRKLNATARVRVYASYPAEGTMLPPPLLAAIGRADSAAPDYFTVLGILHELGCRPTLDWLPARNRLADCASFEAVLARVSDALGELDAAEAERLRGYCEANRAQLGTEPMRWALFSWEPRA